MYRMERRPVDTTPRAQRLLSIVIDVAPFFVLSLFFPFSRYGTALLVLAYRMACDLLGADTIGKRITRLEVVTTTGGTPSRTRRVLREAPYLGLAAVLLTTELIFHSRESWAESTTAQVVPVFIVLNVLNLAFWDLIVALISGRWSLHDLVARTTVRKCLLPT
jgi:hypothetical protein